MPRARPVNNLTPEMPLPQAVAEILRVKLPEVLQYEKKARRGHVEGIHDMRVASKRLREALRVLRPGLSGRQRDQLLPPVERLNDALGLVRDCDVLGEELAALAGPEPPPTVQRLHETLQKWRETQHEKLLRLLDELREDDLAGLYEAAGRKPAKLAKAPAVKEFAREAVLRRLGPVVDNLPAVLTPDDVEAFHRERINVKKLKYALELFLTLLPRRTRGIYNDISILQELMGKVHDLDVLTDVVQTWQEEQGAAPELAELLQRIGQQRAELAAETRQHALAMQEARFAERLSKVMHRHGG